jgi:hypothetical protein
MAEWYYTTNKQQMGPVSLEELRQLANNGVVQPADLVWREGMSDWVRASTQALFLEDRWGGALDSGLPMTARLIEDVEDQPRRRSLLPDRDADDDLQKDPTRGRRREGTMPVGVKVGLIVGGVVVLLMVAGVGLFFLFRPAQVAGQVAVGLGDHFGVLRANDPRDVKTGGPSSVYTVRMIAGRSYTIDMRSNQMDAFLRLEDSAVREVAFDDDGGGGVNGLDARIVYRCPRTDNYRVVATCLHNGRGAYTLSIREN